MPLRQFVAGSIGLFTATIYGANVPSSSQPLSVLSQGFEPNRGQADPRVDFVSHGLGYSVSLSPGEAWLHLAKPDASGRPAQLDTVSLKFIGANRRKHGQALEPQTAKSTYFIGNDPAKWQKEMPRYSRVEYRQIYPGIDVAYYGNGEHLEYDLLLGAHADPGKIRLQISGADRIRIDETGDLVLTVGQAEIRERRPVVYQDTPEGRRQVRGRYIALGGRQIGFAVTGYDAAEPLVIDPVLVFSTYFGGAGDDYASTVNLDAAGNIYVSGFTASSTLPGTRIGQPFTGTGPAAFIAKISPSGTLLFATYIAGYDDQTGATAAIDASGNIYLTGGTKSPTFPLVNPLQSTYGGGASDAYVLELNSAGNAIVFSTFVGGDGQDPSNGIAVDSLGNVYVAGWTKSTNFRTQSAIQTHLAGINNAYAFKLAPGGTAFIYSTYIGGNGIDYANGLTIDSSGNAYIYGDTTSTNFPLQNAMQPSFCGWTSGPPAAAHGYVTVLGSSGSLVYSTYVCGSAAQDSVRGAAVAANGDLVITGQTMSTTFPILNGLQTTSGGGVDAFMTALSPSGGLVYSSYLGGNGTDIGRGVAFDSIGNWYFTGQTSSTNFPTVNPVQSAYGGGSSDVFVTKISGAGTTIAFSTYLGGSDDDIARSIVVDSLAQAYITGNTKSSDFPTANPIQATFGGGKDDAFWSVIATCDFTFSSPSAVSSAGGAGSISITTTPQCGWTATSNNSFITLTSTASGTGSGSISYSVAPSNGSARTGTVTIAGQTITITQSAGPAISGVNPSTGAQGAANFAFAITGTMTHFVAGMSAVAFSGTGITAGAITVVDATHLSVNVSIAATAPLGARDVIVTTGTEVATSPAGFTVVPASALASISPNNGVAGGTFAVTLNGTNLNGAIINAIPGITITPASSTATTVTATFAIALGAAIGPQTVTVTNAGAISNGLTFTINPPSPSLTSISPNNGVAGDAGFAVTLNGANLSGANINAISGITISGVSSTATSVSATFTIASGASSGPQNVTVTTAGGTSNAVVFTVIPQPPTLSSISPNSASAGSAAFSVTLNGTNLSGATINPVPGITITGVSSTASSATATFAIASGATTGPQNVTVTTAGGTSNSVAFTISAPIPALTSISPNSGVAGSPAVGVTLNGTNLSGATINSIPGITITGVTSTASTVTAAFTISSAATAGPQSVTVATAGGTSNAVTFTINVPAVGAAITSTPSGASVTITGAGCASGTFITPATLNWNASVLCRVSFADPLTSGGATYAFQSSTVNGSSGSRSSSVFVPSGTAALTINATYLAAAGLASSGTATHFSIVPSSFAANPGVPIQFTVTALDGSNNPATTYSDPVHFASSDGLSSLPPDTALINGVGTFTASFVTIGSQTITATDLFVPTITGSSGSITLSNASGLTFIPITPCRVMDTRPGRPFTGAFGVPYLSANTSRSIPIPTGACGTFPGALAYSMNVTVVPHSTLSFLTIWPSGQPQPAHASTLNSLDGRYKANAAIVPAGTGGAVSVYVTDATDVIVDINGYFVPNTTPGGLVFYPMTPCRVMDTRMGHGFAGLYGPPSLTPPFVGATSGTSRTLPVQSSTNCTIPPTAQVYSLNFTVVPVAGAPLGWLSAWPHGQPEPSASILNAPTGTIVANAAIIPAGTDSAGSIDIFVHDATDVIVDINGYFAPPGAGGLSFYPLTPCRVTDTRMARGGSGPFSGSMDDNVLGVSTTGNVCGGTPSAQAYVFNATVAPPAPLPYLTLWPQGAMLPHASTLNANDGAITSNMAIVPTTNTEISAYANTPTDLILDLAGYFAP